MANEEYQEAFGTYLKQCRKRKGYSQNQFAELADLTPAYLSAVERGIANPRLDTLKKMANGLGCTVADLFLFETVESGSKDIKERFINFILSADTKRIEDMYSAFMDAMLRR